VWADENRILPPGSAEPGPWRTVRTPYLVPILQACAEPRYRRVVVVMGSQMGKTEALLNVIGHKLDDDPAPTIIVCPSQRLAESMSTSRLMPMIRSTPSLHAKLDKRRTSDKLTEKYVGGQRLGLAWAGSAIELASHPAALIVVDERDRMAGDVDGEGDPVQLAEARVATYPDGKVIVTSTPTLEGASPIMDLYSSGTMFRWTWPCPDCEVYFAPELALVKWPEKSTPSQAKREARLACPNCGSLIADRHRSSMNSAGRFELTGDADSDTASFLVSGLASPWRSWGEAARAWVEAARSGEPGRVQAVLNTVFGELYRIKGEAPEAARVMALRGAYKFDEIPVEARVVTLGVDVQQDSLVFAVRAWGMGSTSWLLRHGELWGDTSLDDVWTRLGDLLEQTWGQHRIRLALVDSGFRADMAYAFASRHPGRVLPSKGHDTQTKPVAVVNLDVDARGQKRRRSVKLAHVDAGYFKSWVHGRIEWPHDQPGAFHLPVDATDDYCEQLIAEQRVVKSSGKVIWIRTRKANHYLDCEVLNAAAAHLLGVHAIKRGKVKPDTAPEPITAPAPSAKPVDPLRMIRRPQLRRTSWVNRWR
jgi:phage terminase large subunit GpA-like protein